MNVMDMDIAKDVMDLDPELLQLPEVSPLALKTSPQIAEELFGQWLSLPDTGRLVYYSILIVELSDCSFVVRAFKFICFGI